MKTMAEVCACMGGNRILQNDGHLAGVPSSDARWAFHNDHINRRHRFIRGEFDMSEAKP